MAYPFITSKIQGPLAQLIVNLQRAKLRASAAGGPAPLRFINYTRMRDVQIFIHRFIRTTNNTRTLKNYKRNKRYAAMTRRPSTVIGVDAVQLLLQYTVYRIVGLYISLPQCRSMYRRAPPPPPAPACTCMHRHSYITLQTLTTMQLT